MRRSSAASTSRTSVTNMWPGRVRDGERRSRRHDRGLRRDAAGPEHRDLAVAERPPGRRSPAGRGRRCRGPPGRRSARARRARPARCAVTCTARATRPGGHRPHRHHQRRRAAARRAGTRGWCGTSARCGPARRAGPGTPASSSAASKVKLQPMRNVTRSSRQYVRHVGRLVDQLAVAPDPVARQVGAQVGARGERRRPRAGLGDVEHRARLGVALAEQQQVVRPVARARRPGWPGRSPRPSRRWGRLRRRGTAPAPRRGASAGGRRGSCPAVEAQSRRVPPRSPAARAAPPRPDA